MDLKRSNRSCCVVGCRNTEKKCGNNKSIKFYSFPGKYYEEKRKQQWIIAVNRKNPDGTLWQPTATSKICSEHFIAGRKSDIFNNPSYVPSVFPFCKPANGGDTSMIVEKFKKVRKVYSLSALKTMLHGTVNAATQVDFQYDNASFVFSSSPDDTNYNCKYVQCNIGYNFLNIKPSKNVSCGPSGMFLSDLLKDMHKRKVAKTKNK